jgi:SAM-dependent methyltransferase
MTRSPLKSPKTYAIKPSSFLKKHYEEISSSLQGSILDIPSGTGRNALFFQAQGCHVVCVDNDFTALHSSLKLNRMNTHLAKVEGDMNRAMRSLSPVWIDLSKEQWPFRSNAFAAIINVHFVMPQLFKFFQYSLMPGGYLFCETFGGQGENYLQLPKPGEWRALLESWLDIKRYEEKVVGPISHSAVTVKVFGKKFDELTDSRAKNYP